MADTAVFECKLCLKPFDERIHRPLSLPCGHVFCESCVQKPGLRSSTVCPVHHTQFPISPSHLPTCYTILVNLPKGKPPCLMCALHPRHKLKFRCLSHRQNLCTDCIVSHSDSGHRVASLETFTLQTRSEANEVSETLQKRLSSLEEGRKWVEKCETKLAGLYETQTQLVKQTYDEAVQDLQQKKTELLRELSALWSRQSRDLENEKTSLIIRLQRLSETVRGIREAQERLPGSIEELESLLAASRCDSRETWHCPDLSNFLFQGALRIADQSVITRRVLEPCNSKDSLRPIGTGLPTSSSHHALRDPEGPQKATTLSHGPQLTPRSMSKASKGQEQRRPPESTPGSHKDKSHRKRSVGRVVPVANASF